MKIYKKVKKISDLLSVDFVNSNEFTIIAYNGKNYKIPVSLLKQKKITKIVQDENNSSGHQVPLNVVFNEGNKLLFAFNGSEGDKGNKGAAGERGPKGQDVLNSALNKEISKNWLMLINDLVTNDKSSALSAYQGQLMYKELENISETFLTDYQYNLLFVNDAFVLIEAEFETTEENQTVQLINEDEDIHDRYTKYWTFEDEGEEEFYTFNYFTAENYPDKDPWDVIYADLWEDIYFGNLYGYFEASSNQLVDGSPLYIKDNFTNEYTLVKTDEFGNRIFEPYYLKSAECYIDIKYIVDDGYTFNLDNIVKELPLNIYEKTGVDRYENVSSIDDLDLTGITVYYYKDENGAFLPIENIENAIERKTNSYYIVSGNGWEEVEFNDIDRDNYQEYIHVKWDKLTNATTFTHYEHVITIREDEYYNVLTETMYNYSLTYYIYQDREKGEKRKYATKKLISTVDENGNYTFEYIYIDIVLPIWIDATFITESEDQRIILINKQDNPNETEDKDVIDPIYIDLLEFSDASINDKGEIVIAKNRVKNIPVNMSPTNANVIDIIMEYDSDIITLFEDGRIASIDIDEVTTTTKIKIYSEHDENVSDELILKIITPVEKIIMSEVDTDIIVYPGESFNLNYYTEPELVTNPNVKWTISDNDMLEIDVNNNVTPKKQLDNSYKTGYCTIIGVAEDNFGASIILNVFVAIPIESLEFISKPFAFVDVEYKAEVKIYPENATNKNLIFSSSNPEIIKVIDENEGIFMPLQPASVEDNCRIIVTTTDGTNLQIESNPLTISNGVEEIIVEGLENKLEVDLTNEFTVTILPEIAKNKDIAFNVTDNTVVQCSQLELIPGEVNKYAGKLTAIKPGNTTLVFTAMDGSGTETSHDMDIIMPVGNIYFENNRLRLKLGETKSIEDLRLIIGPTDADQTVKWSTSNDGIISITSKEITALNVGKTVLTAMSNDNNAVMASCEITVIQPCEQIILNDGIMTEFVISKDNYGFINAVVLPDNASIQILNWESLDQNIVSIENNGSIFGRNYGETIITAIATDGSEISESLLVKVI